MDHHQLSIIKKMGQNFFHTKAKPVLRTRPRFERTR